MSCFLQGKPNCLAGLTFLVTGVLESLERDECCSIIKEYGGKTMTVVGKRLNYLIAGEDSGPKKLAQADEFGVKVINEDGFFNLIREKSGMKKDNDQAETSSSSTRAKEEKRISKEDKKSYKMEKSASPPEKKPKIEELNHNLKKTKPKVDLEDKKPVIIPEKEKKERTESKNENVEDNKPTTSSVRDDMMAWVDKYKPASVKDIIGQQGPASNVAK